LNAEGKPGATRFTRSVIYSRHRLTYAMGQRSEALPPTLEAVKITRELARTNPAFLPDLANALNTLGFFYTQLEKRSEALPLLEEAVQLFTRLVATYPASFKEDLHRARNNLEYLKRQQDLASGNQPIAPGDRSYLNASDPDTPLRRSVVRLWATFADGIGKGTGFVLRRQGDRAWIATARHVVITVNTNAPSTELKAELYSGTLPANIPPAQLSVVLPTPAQRDASSGDDLIVLEIRGLPPDIAALPLGSDPPPGTLKVVGHPSDRPPWSVMSLPLLKGNREEFFLDGSLEPGASGSPVFDGSNQVVGLVYETDEIGRKRRLPVVSAYGSSVLKAALQSLAPAGR
jgi:superkiller protein 3